MKKLSNDMPKSNGAENAVTSGIHNQKASSKIHL
jgi:hypothetical protein